MIDPALEQIRRWELAATAEAAKAAHLDVIAIGPFRALIARETNDVWHNMAIPAEALGDDAGALEAIEAACRVFRERQRMPHFEFNDGSWPSLAGLLQRAGLTLQARHPLMACSPGDFRPVAAPGVTIRFLGEADSHGDLDAFQAVRRTGFGEPFRASTPEEIAWLRLALERNQNRFALGRLEGIPAGTGVLNPIGGVGEIVGVATLPEFRRRGVAATLTSALVQDLFGRGGTLAWLDAEDPIAQAVYERLSFRLVGARLSYVAAS